MGCREEKNFLTTRKKYIKYSFFYKGYFMSSFASLPERLKTIATESSFAAAYGPTEMIRLLDSDEPPQQKRLLLDILRSHKDALNPHKIDMDPRVEYALTQAEKNPAIRNDGRTPTYSQFLSEFSCILRIAAEMDKKIEALAEQTSKDPKAIEDGLFEMDGKIQALAEQTSKDPKAIEDGLFEILMESSRVVPDKPDTMEYDRALHAVELFVRHPESKGLMRGLGENGERPLLGRINKVVSGNIHSQMSVCLEIEGAFRSFGYYAGRG